METDECSYLPSHEIYARFWTVKIASQSFLFKWTFFFSLVPSESDLILSAPLLLISDPVLENIYIFIKPIHKIKTEKSFWIPESIGNFEEYSVFFKDDWTATHFADGFLFLVDFSLESYFAITKFSSSIHIQQFFFEFYIL